MKNIIWPNNRVTHDNPEIQSLLDRFYKAMGENDETERRKVAMELYEKDYNMAKLPGFSG